MRFCLSLENVCMVLSGMSDHEQLADNMKTFEENKALSGDEKELINKILYPEIKKTKKLMVPKDIRLFINTIDHAVSTMLTAGIKAKTEKNETEEYIECIVRIPKINKR